MSVTPAGGNGTMILTGLLGYCWANAEPGITSATASATMRMNLLISGLSLVAFSPPVVVLAIGGRADIFVSAVGSVDASQSAVLIDVQLMAPVVRAGTRRTYRRG